MHILAYRISVVVNQLETETDEERALFAAHEKIKVQRKIENGA